MKLKILKAILLIFVCFLGSCLVFQNNNHQSIDTIVADYPRAIKKLHINLPDIADVYSYYNRYRGVSGWKCSGHKITFTSPLPERTIKQLERKAERRSGIENVNKRISYISMLVKKIHIFTNVQL